MSLNITFTVFIVIFSVCFVSLCLSSAWRLKCNFFICSSYLFQQILNIYFSKHKSQHLYICLIYVLYIFMRLFKCFIIMNLSGLKVLKTWGEWGMKIWGVCGPDVWAFMKEDSRELCVCVCVSGCVCDGGEGGNLGDMTVLNYLDQWKWRCLVYCVCVLVCGH